MYVTFQNIFYEFEIQIHPALSSSCLNLSRLFCIHGLAYVRICRPNIVYTDNSMDRSQEAASESPGAEIYLS
jgi:hypothetical protein